MKCYLCSKSAKIKQQKGRAICDDCFVRLIEKRIRKYTRLNKIFKPEDKILIKGDLSKYFVESITKDLPVKIFSNKNKKSNKIAIDWTADDEANLFLEELFLGKKAKVEKRYIRLLRVITDKEAELFSKIKKLKFKRNKKNKDIQKLIDDMEKKDPGAKYRLLKNFDMLNRLTLKVK